MAIKKDQTKFLDKHIKQKQNLVIKLKTLKENYLTSFEEEQKIREKVYVNEMPILVRMAINLVNSFYSTFLRIINKFLSTYEDLDCIMETAVKTLKEHSKGISEQNEMDDFIRCIERHYVAPLVVDVDYQIESVKEMFELFEKDDVQL
ncbi:hypothetical protein EIN_097060 [Entamoeba invadens IP1]|uniref:Uncharacterized protein n=1 Tax=Entamoeba invadens IP1 TaxID=370355 RepID=A0A0A1U0M0_ENTIV|nr:hypothetical protein EIN_097060 [Entamoeba invadens IP1]ELP87439.1 hypothetical protein EIN_097060 [Entamoeba invadens IP1]|eukprot:XP_004254210.1 hypothetical protein EIN_097060 [Entamoeba invadens IP1]